MPAKPSAAALRSASTGNSAFSSHRAACGRSSSRANCRAVSWKASWSSLRRKSMASPGARRSEIDLVGDPHRARRHLVVPRARPIVVVSRAPADEAPAAPTPLLGDRVDQALADGVAARGRIDEEIVQETGSGPGDWTWRRAEMGEPDDAARRRARYQS